MPIRINYNICDNSPECSGISVCKSGALYWDNNKISPLGTKGLLSVDNGKCISCGKCVGDDGCSVGALIFFETEESLSNIEPIDINKIKRLFVDRYGAEPIDNSLCKDIDEIIEIVTKNTDVIMVEEYNDSSIQCLLTSIPVETLIREISNAVGTSKIEYFKCDVSNCNNKSEHLPVLKIYKRNKLISKIEGYFDNSNLDLLISKIKTE